MPQKCIEGDDCCESDSMATNLSKKLVYLSAFVLVCLTGLGHIPPNPWGGFYCNDDSIWKSRQTDTVSTYLLLVMVFIPPIIVMYMTEKIVTTVSKSDSTPNRRSEVSLQENAWGRTKKVYGKYLAGLLLTTLFNELTKVAIAEPRPHFMQTCNPDLSSGVCASEESFVFYSEISCKESNVAGDGVPRRVTDSMKSFPSGHAQLSAFSAAFITMYLLNHSKLKTTSEVLWKFVCIVVFVLFAIVASVSRVFDHRHHWWDVLAGDIFGVSTVLVMTMFCSPLLETRR